MSVQSLNRRLFLKVIGVTAVAATPVTAEIPEQKLKVVKFNNNKEVVNTRELLEGISFKRLEIDSPGRKEGDEKWVREVRVWVEEVDAFFDSGYYPKEIYWGEVVLVESLNWYSLDSSFEGLSNVYYYLKKCEKTIIKKSPRAVSTFHNVGFSKEDLLEMARKQT